MKQYYINPKVKVVYVNPSKMTCVSFGEGETDVMHTKQNYGFIGETDCYEEEE